MKALKITGICLLALIILGAAIFGGLYIKEQKEIENAPDPAIRAEEIRQELYEAVKAGTRPESLSENGVYEGGSLAPEKLPETQQGKMLYESCLSSVNLSLSGPVSRDKRQAQQKMSLSYGVLDGIFDNLNGDLNAALAEKVNEAERASQIYTGDNEFKEEIVDELYLGLFEKALNEGEKSIETRDFELKLNYSEGSWSVSNKEELQAALMSWNKIADYDAEAEKIKQESISPLTYVPIHYRVDEKALRGPVPGAENFHESRDPYEIAELLKSDEAQKLINGQELAWSPELDHLPDSTVYCYLDETLLAICWQEVTAKAVGTYTEVICADGSQIRRRIAGDAYEDPNHKTTTEFALDCNGVVTLGGDFYHHGRNCGIVVIDREIYRFDPNTCDCCYITGDGDMVFSYRWQFETQEQAQAYVDDNDILYSLCFGPILIDEYEDVTPETYQWGEINDTYARSAIGMLGEHHYLTLNINCQAPGYYYLATLRDAADAMISKGCRKAYTLDGGQTATTVFNGTLINPVQFGWEKPISDVIYFCSALPEE